VMGFTFITSSWKLTVVCRCIDICYLTLHLNVVIGECNRHREMGSEPNVVRAAKV